MHDEPEGSWDWDRAFDEDFVRGARAREGSGADRAERAARIAAGHRGSQAWRSGAPLLDAQHRSGPRRRRTREGGRGLLVVLALLLVGAVLLGTGVVGGPDDRSPLAAPAQVDPPTSASPAPPPRASTYPPVPGDAAPGRLLPLPEPVGGRGGYRFSALGEPRGSVRFDPCRPVHWVVRPDGAPRGGTALLTEAFAQLSAATGLRFTADGGTTEDPDEARRPVDPDRYGDVFSPVLVAWSDPRESPRLRGDVAAYAGPLLGDDGRGVRLASGQVVLDAPLFRSLRARGDQDEALGIVLHELGHLAGLDHVPDPGDIMHARSRSGAAVTSWTTGARRGLRLLGAGTCFS